MASEKQVEMFNRLIEEKQLPEGQDVTALKAKFADLDTGSASEWIEKALSLEDKDRTPPPF